MHDFLSEASFWVPEFLDISAWIEHAPFAFWLMDIHRPDLLVELGTHNGFSYLTLNQALKALGLKTRSFAVDTWKGDEHSGLYGDQVFQRLFAYNYEHYFDFSELVRASFDEAVDRFKDGSIDLLHIDGRHFYEDVKHDFETWKPKLSGRGVVLIHDTNVRIRDFGVYQLWRELSHEYPHFEFVHGHGLGVLGVGGAIPEKLKRLFEAAGNPEATRQIREAYTRLGTALVDRMAVQQEIAAKQDLQQQYDRLHNSYKELEERNQQLAQDDAECSRLEDNFGQSREECRRLAESEQNARSENEQLQRKHTELNEHLKRKEFLNAELTRELAAVEKRLSRVTGSTMWRLTSPLRRLSRVANLKTSRLLLPIRILWWLVTLQLRTRMRLRANKRLIAVSKLFDRNFYLRQYPDADATDIDPLEHYLVSNAKEARNPNPLFDSRWYITQNPDVVSRGLNPLLHYVQMGWKEGRNPGPLFDVAFYLKNNPDVAVAGMEPLAHFLHPGGAEGRNPHPLFDSAFYLELNPDVAAKGVNPLVHYLQSGWVERRDPHPFFDTSFYLTSNPDVAETGINPLIHFLESGGAEKRNPHPLFHAAFYLERNPDVAGSNPLVHFLRFGWSEHRDPHPLFDTRFYLNRNPDVAASAGNPSLHFLRSGWCEKRDPHPLFDTAFYLDRNRDVASGGINPLLHYLTSGWKGGRDPHPLFDTALYLQRNPNLAETGTNPLVHYLLSGSQTTTHPHALFDNRYYLDHNPDVAKAGTNPLLHFLQEGWREKRDPHPLFEIGWYFQSNPDVAERGVNPVLHYQLGGWKERRSPGPFFDGGFYLDEYPDIADGTRSSLEHYLLFGTAENRNPNRAFNTGWYRRSNRDVMASGTNPLVHYVLFGRFEKRRTRPIAAASASLAATRAKNALPHIVFISGEDHTPGHQYRVVNIAESLPRTRFQTTIIANSEISGHSAVIASADLVWIWRAPISDELTDVIDQAHDRGAKVIFDVDDLMFRPELAIPEVIDGIRSQGFLQSAVEDFYSRVQGTLVKADYCTFPTETLACEARALWMPASVIPNGFDRTMFGTARRARQMRGEQSPDGLVRMGYAAGSRTHQRDFGMIAPVLTAILSENPSARLVLFRPVLVLEEFPELQRVGSQIEWRDIVPLETLPLEYARFDINLAPLEVGNRFCEAKSELKFFEAALVGVPTVASPTRPFAEAIRHGETGFLANSDKEWYETLTRLVRDRELREAAARRAYNEVLWLYGPERRSQLATRLVYRLLEPAPVSSELFALGAQLESHPELPPIAVPDYDVLFESGNSGQSRVSIIIPVFNYAHYLEGALESVRAQTCRELDLIVVDDQSRDNSVAIARTWLKDHASEFNRVALLQNRRNAKLGASRNAAVSFSDTEVFFPLDPDNLLFPDCIERCLARLDKTGAAYVYPGIEIFGDRSGEMGTHDYEPDYFRYENYIDAMAMVRKAVWIAVGGYSPLDPPGYEDFDFWAKLAENGFYGERLPEVVARYRSHGSSMLAITTNVPENRVRVIQDVSANHPWLRMPVLDVLKGKTSSEPRRTHAIAADDNQPFDNQGVARILPILRCPETAGKLVIDGDEVISEITGRRWPLVKGRPVFTAEGRNVIVQSETHLSNEFPPAVVALFEETPGYVLNLSAGGTPKRYPNVVELEYTIFRHTDAVGDVHRLPFQDEVFDAVVCLNAFEHYREPDVAMEEIRRVLKPGGRFFMHTAFLQPLHEAPHHYYNCTEFGLRHWLRHFHIECIRVSPNFNPAYTLSWLASETEAAFSATVSAQTAAAVGDARLRELARFWRDPGTRDSPLWKYFYDLPPSAQHKLAAGWEAVAVKA